MLLGLLLGLLLVCYWFATGDDTLFWPTPPRAAQGHLAVHPETPDRSLPGNLAIRSCFQRGSQLRTYAIILSYVPLSRPSFPVLSHSLRALPMPPSYQAHFSALWCTWYIKRAGGVPTSTECFPQWPCEIDRQIEDRLRRHARRDDDALNVDNNLEARPFFEFRLFFV